MFDHIEPEADEALTSPASPVTTCQEPGCSGSTTHSKPYCQDHLDRIPSVRALMARWEKVAVYSEDGRCVVGESDIGTPAPGERADLVRPPLGPTAAKKRDREAERAERRRSVLEAVEQLGDGLHTVTEIAERAGYVLAVVGQELRALAAKGYVVSEAGLYRIARVPA